MMLKNRNSHLSESLQMLRRSTSSLSPEALEQIKTFIKSQLNPEGGFINRSGQVDLYYTVFGLICSAAFDLPISHLKFKHFLEKHDIGSLSLVDLSSYVKCQALLHSLCNTEIPQETVDECLLAIEKYKTSKGSFSYDGKGEGFPYALFLAVNFYLDLGLKVSQKEEILKALYSYRTEKGAFSNPQSGHAPMLLSTAAAIHVMRYLTREMDSESVEWISKQYLHVGGFLAAPDSPFPDMLSTGVSLFTLSLCGNSFDSQRKNIRQFIDDHWDKDGGFRATLIDEGCDCEYTYYALLALGSIQ